MKKVIAAFALSTIATVAVAGPHCNRYPAEQRMDMNQVQAQLEKQGYQVREMEYDDGCYEVKGTDAQGRKVKLYLDTKSGKIVGEKNKGMKKDKKRMTRDAQNGQMRSNNNSAGFQDYRK